MGFFRNLFDKIRTGLSRGLTEVPRFIRGIGEKITNIPAIGEIAKLAYNKLVPEPARMGLEYGLKGAEALGKAIAPKRASEPIKPSGPVPQPPGKPGRPPPPPPLEHPSRPPPPPPGKKAPPITREDVERIIRAPIMPLPQLPPPEHKLIRLPPMKMKY